MYKEILSVFIARGFSSFMKTSNVHPRNSGGCISFESTRHCIARWFLIVAGGETERKTRQVVLHITESGAKKTRGETREDISKGVIDSFDPSLGYAPRPTSTTYWVTILPESRTRPTIERGSARERELGTSRCPIVPCIIHYISVYACASSIYRTCFVPQIAD